jgi:chromosome segregation ATPase
MKKTLPFFLFALSIAGCASYGPEELDRLTKEDPQFRQMIAGRDKAHAEIRAIKNDLLSKKRIIDAQVEKLRRDYDVYSKAQNEKIEQYRGSVQASQSLMKREVEAMSAKLQARETELEGYQKTLADVQKVIKESKGFNLSEAERQRWEERVLLLSEKIRPLLDEIQELKLQIRLKKQKMYFLK